MSHATQVFYPFANNKSSSCLSVASSAYNDFVRTEASIYGFLGGRKWSFVSINFSGFKRKPCDCSNLRSGGQCFHFDFYYVSLNLLLCCFLRLSPKLMKRYSCSLNFHMAKMNSSLNILQSCVLVEFCGHDCLLSSLERVFSWLCLVWI